MKKYYPTTVLFISLLSILVNSCASTNELTIPITKPAPVWLPASIQSIAILDRSLPSEDHVIVDQIDKILSIEGKNLDKFGAQASVQGLIDELNRTQRFAEIKTIDSSDVRSPGLGIHPAALSWETVERLCHSYNVDVLFVLSFYDTDAKISYKTVPVKIMGPLGIEVPVLEHQAKISTLIKTGWRIYDPIKKHIRDEYIEHSTVRSTGTGINPIKAVEAVINRKEAVLQISHEIGLRYALRLFPYRTRVKRDYYVKGTNNFEIAMRRARTGDWQGAADLWEQELDNPKGKIAGRACYNMGIINEINGELEAAIEWASKAYTDYKNKDALSYIKVLKYRIRKNNELQNQLEN